MASTPGPHNFQYTSDAAVAYYYPMHLYLGTAQSANPLSTVGGQPLPKWPFKRSWMRHIGVLFSDGTRDEIPIMSPANTLYLDGGTISVAFPTGIKTGVITGRRDEKMHLAHA